MKSLAKKKKNGKVIEYYDNKKVKYTGSMKNGEMHGEWKFYRRDGSIMRSGRFNLGVRRGIWKTYTRDGVVVKETEFKNNTK